MSRLQSTHRGFTLIETVVVMAIIAVLAAIVYVCLAPVRDRSRETRCLSNFRQIARAMEMYRTDVGGVDTPSPATEMGFPRALYLLTPYASHNEEFLHCTSIPYEVQQVTQVNQRSNWSLYSYNVWGDWKRLPGFPAFEAAVRERGDDFPLVSDSFHDRPPLDRPISTRRLIVLHLDGRVKVKNVPKRLQTWQW